MTRGRFVLDEKTGEFKEGKAGPELLPTNLRELPGELVTKDIDDETKAHALDPDHVVADIKEHAEMAELREKLPALNAEERRKQDVAAKVKALLEFIPPGVRGVPLNQKRVDGVRFRILKVLVDNAYEKLKKGEQYMPTLFHVWFPHDDCNIYELRAGTPPVNSMRPARLRGLDLVLDLECWPQRIIEALQACDVEVPAMPSKGVVNDDLPN